MCRPDTGRPLGGQNNNKSRVVCEAINENRERSSDAPEIDRYEKLSVNDDGEEPTIGRQNGQLKSSRKNEFEKIFNLNVLIFFSANNASIPIAST